MVTVICECVLSLSKTRRFCEEIFFLYFPIISIWLNYSWNLYNGHLRDIEESGHSTEVERRVIVGHVWTVRRKKQKQNKRWPLRKKHLILTEINEAILLSIEGYCVCRDRYAVFRKLPHSRKLYLCMNSASRIFFSASFACTKSFARPKKICVVGLFTSHTNIEHQMSDQKNYAN